MDCQIFAVQRYKNHVNATAFYEYDNMVKIFKNLAAENPVAVRNLVPLSAAIFLIPIRSLKRIFTAVGADDKQ